jgi:cobalamin-dependent methionine synthase I
MIDSSAWSVTEAGLFAQGAVVNSISMNGSGARKTHKDTDNFQQW